MSSKSNILRLSVALLPNLIDPQQLSGSVAVVTDVLRAATTMITALSEGARRIIPSPSIPAAEALREKLDGQAIWGGERQGIRIPGFDLGNSPAEYTRSVVDTRDIVLCTTNGSVAVEATRTCRRVFIGAFVNCSAVADRVAHVVETTRKNQDSTGPQEDRVVIVCAGTHGQITSEDALFAGAVVDYLLRRFPDAVPDDQAQLALASWREIDSSLYLDLAPPGAGEQLNQQLFQRLSQSFGGINLLRIGFDEDIQLCSKFDAIPLVPELNTKTWSVEVDT